MKITFVKKILKNGQPCPKCQDVESRLIAEQQMDFIDATLIADERDSDSEGMRLAIRYEVTRAPFFVVEDGNDVKIYTVYFKFAKEILGKTTDSATEAQEILNDHAGLEYL